MQIRIFHNPRCSKSRQTLNILQEQGVEADVVEYLKTPPSAQELKDILKLLGIKARDLLRKGEEEYKSLGLSNPDLSEQAIISAMVEHPKLIERPIVIVDGKKAVIGRPPENVISLLS